MAMGHRVLFAGNEWQRKYMLETIPGLPTIHLDGYNVRYATSGSMFMAAIGKQVPAILKTVSKEHKWLERVIAAHKIDRVISDNRYGLYHRDVPSAIMTHQLNAMSGWGNMADALVRKLHYWQLEKFDQCWVVDTPEAPGLAGKLSHPKSMPRNVEYMGLLSQVEETQVEKKGYLLVLLSGPEPQRTLLSQKIWEQLQHYRGQVIFTEGKADVPTPLSVPAHIEHHAILTKEELRKTIQGADMVICRSGYSTVMDLVKLNKKAIFIPTPGQTEQEYLAKDLQQQGAFPFVYQDDFNLVEALRKAETFSYNIAATAESYNMYKAILENWLK